MSTSRLKRKAQDDPDLLENNNLNESFVSYGTPLPSLASTRKDQGEYVPIWKQEVRDEKGRRRLHGAFTGGFSAGYFNTVGSKEGWTPSTFVSKKDAKAQGRSTTSGPRPEDFMDEEDLAELKASKQYKASEEYAAAGTSAAGSGGLDEGFGSAIANAVKDIVKPGTSRIGEKIMQQMGWRPGQGVGPRVSFKRREQQLRDLGLPMTGNEEDHSEEVQKHLYAPVDRPLMLFDTKENTQGLGYIAGKNLMQELGTSRNHDTATRGRTLDEGPSIEGKRMPTGGAFGISALEDADDDDIDIYLGQTGQQSFIQDDDDDAERRPSFRGPKLLDRGVRGGNALKERMKPPRQPEATQKFADGTPVIKGFKLASTVQSPHKWFPPAAIPKGWQPNPKAVWKRDRIKVADDAPTPSGAAAIQQKGKQNMLTADDRASIIGETVKPRSIFEYISSKDKERLMSLAEDKSGQPSPFAVDPSKGGLAQGPAVEELAIRRLEPRVAQAALKGFMPYGDDPPKQARYKAFLEHSAMPTNTVFAPKPASGKSMADLNKELQDFASAAAIFKPMTGMMANRFTSGGSSAVLDVKAPQAGLRVPVAQPNKVAEVDGAAEAKKKQEEDKRKDEADPRRIAVKCGQYGPLTRSSEPWYPSRLLCKRFNVPDPHPEGQAAAEPFAGQASSAMGSQASGTQDVLGKDTMDELMRSSAASGSSSGQAATTAPPARYQGEQVTGTSQQEVAIPSLASVGLGEDESQGRDTLTYEKPPMDIFKAIFADSEDEDETDENDKPNDVAAEQAKGASAPMDIDDPSAPPPEAIFAPATQPKQVALDMETLTTFKPTFVTKSDRESAKDSKDKKEKKKKKKAVAALSFDVEDGDVSTPAASSGKKDKGAKKRKTGANTGGTGSIGEAEDEWVEKEVAVPVAVNTDPRKGGRVRASELF